jgi:hypothetical protein
MNADCRKQLTILFSTRVKKRASFLRRTAIVVLPLLYGVAAFSCKEGKPLSRQSGKIEISRQNIAHPIDTAREIHHGYSFLQKIDSVDFHRIDSLLSLSSFPSSIPKRVELFSRCFLGSAFSGDGPTGEGCYDTVDTAPIYNIHCFDCLTYVEHVFALALSGNVEDFLPNLVRLRYKDGSIDYVHRNHFFETDWLANNKGIATLIHPKNGVMITRTISKKSFFAQKHLTVSVADTVISIYAWSIEGFTAALAGNSIEPGVYLIAFIKKNYRTVITNHVGFAIIYPDAAYLRDASKTRGRVVQSDLKRYLDHNSPRLEGLLLARVITGSDPRQHPYATHVALSLASQSRIPISSVKDRTLW